MESRFLFQPKLEQIPNTLLALDGGFLTFRGGNGFAISLFYNGLPSEHGSTSLVHIIITHYYLRTIKIDVLRETAILKMYILLKKKESLNEFS